MVIMSKRTLRPFKDVILKLDKPIEETIKTAGGLELYLDSSWNPEQHVTVTGKVYALPHNHPYGDSLKVGDVVLFSYMVVADREFADEPGNYHPYIDEENLKIFINGHKEKIQIRAVQGIISKKFVCVHFDKHGEFDYGFEGTKGEVDRWMAQFKYGDVQKYSFTNCIDLDGEILWKCRFDQIFAKKVGEKLISLSNMVILNPVDITVTPDKLEVNGVAVPQSAIKLRAQGMANIESCPEDVKLKKGVKIGYKDQFKLPYTFFGKDYFLLEKDRIEGVWLN